MAEGFSSSISHPLLGQSIGHCRKSVGCGQKVTLERGDFIQIDRRTPSPSLYIDGRGSSHYFALRLSDFLSIKSLLWHRIVIPLDARLHPLEVPLSRFNARIVAYSYLYD
jgi:hypothetical protein